MPKITKNIPEPKQDVANVPIPLLKRKINYEAAGYTYNFDDAEQKYINYNTLRNKKKDQEIIDVVKIYRLQDRDTGKEYYVWYQISKVKDFNNNLVPCPIDEMYGYVDRPETNKVLDASNQIVDIVPVETQIDYTHEFNPEEIKQLMAKSRSPQNIVCYVGYTKPYKTRSNDFIENKRKINSQTRFLTNTFEQLMTLEEKNNLKETFNIRQWKLDHGSNREQRRVKETEQS